MGLEPEAATPPPGGDEGKVRPIRPGGGDRRRLRTGIIVAAILFFLFFLLPSVIYVYTEWLWFVEVGYSSVFLKILRTRVAVGLAAGLFFFAVAYGNMLIARRMAPRYQFGPGAEVIERMPIPDRVVRWLIPALVLLPSLIALAAGAAGWETFLKFTNRTDFGVADPIFGYDVGFYVFTLPFLRMLHSLVWWTLIFTLLATAAMHFFDYAINISGGKLTLAPHVKGHLSVLLGLILFMLGISYWLKGYLLLYSARGVVFGASYTDLHAQLPVYRFLAASAVVAAVLALVNIHFRGWKLPLVAVSIIILTAIFAGQVYPFLVQQYRVSPNELATEGPFIQHNIDFTRRGFDLEPIETRPFAADDTLTGQDIQNNINTVGNVRLWDPRTLSETYRQIQTIRPYYTFLDVDVDRYTFDGRLRQVMLSVREMSIEGLDPRARTWQNEHMVYTHGYGAVIGPVAQVTNEGLPELVAKNIPPQTDFAELEIEQPAIYFGEFADDYVVVRTEIEEFDFPQGEENVYTTYEGDAGINISSYLRRLAFSSRFGSIKLLLSDAVTAESRIIIHRQIKERTENIAHFLTLDNDPYPVVADGRIFWIQDAYTTSGDFPYSQPARDGINYIRNSVKIVVDAYNGDVTLYVVDEEDPLIQTYGKMFPDLLIPGDDMPESLRAHLRYPEDLFRLQADIFATYHMTDARVFYNKEDQWKIPRLQDGAATSTMDPYFVIMNLPGDEREEFMMILPFTPGDRENIIAWLVAKSDPGSYGERIIFKFPKEKLVFGPSQIQARFNQDAAISQQITLWSQAGSQVIFGNLLVIPVEESMLYVQPLYLRAARSQIPEFRRVLVSYAGQIVMETDLATALERIFDVELTGIEERPAVEAEPPPALPGVPEAPVEIPTGAPELAAAALERYERAVDAQRRGDWAAYGSEIQALENILRQMQAGTP
ncbi:MAG: UPF0182 family protein [Thermoleophilia bacterium]|nr:UPF0182 family protein [Thermoleophilia bacterium]